jgi:hypothetical protein
MVKLNTMLKKFGNTAKNIAPILDLMKQETQSVFTSINSGQVNQLGNTVERLGLLTSRLYSEYLSCQNEFAENPDLLNEALNILTKSQEATMEAQQVLSSTSLSGVDEEESEDSLMLKIEKKATLASAVIIPSWMFYMSSSMGPIKGNITKGLALVSGLVSMKHYLSLRNKS